MKEIGPLTYKLAEFKMPAPRCPWNASEHGGCIFCYYPEDPILFPPAPLSPSESTHVLETAIHQKAHYIERAGGIYLACNGSFFDDRQILPESRIAMARLCSTYDIGMYVDQRADKDFLSYLEQPNNQLPVLQETLHGKLGINIGLEAADNRVLSLINKGTDLQTLADVAGKLHKLDVRIKNYILVGVPIVGTAAGSDEFVDATIRLATETIRFAVCEMGAKELGLHHLRAPKHSQLYSEWSKRKLWMPLDPFTFDEVKRLTYQIGKKFNITISANGGTAFYDYYREASKPIRKEDSARVEQARQKVQDIFRSCWGTA